MTRPHGPLLLALSLGLGLACVDRSKLIEYPTAGLNGDFEITDSGVPVNWLVYTPETIPTGDYDLVFDTDEYRSGAQSLKFVVRSCSSVGGWQSPGLSRQFDANAGTTYVVGFWVRNDGAEFHARLGGIATKSGEYETIVRSTETIDDWRHYEYEYTVPESFEQLRFELNILQPGTFWIDAFTIEATS